MIPRFVQTCSASGPLGRVPGAVSPALPWGRRSLCFSAWSLTIALIRDIAIAVCFPLPAAQAARGSPWRPSRGCLGRCAGGRCAQRLLGDLFSLLSKSSFFTKAGTGQGQLFSQQLERLFCCLLVSHVDPGKGSGGFIQGAP